LLKIEKIEYLDPISRILQDATSASTNPSDLKFKMPSLKSKLNNDGTLTSNFVIPEELYPYKKFIAHIQSNEN
jgi:hypothetical protein